MSYTAVVKQTGNSWIGWVAEIPGVNCQESSKDELMASLLVSLVEAIEINRAEAIRLAGAGYEVIDLVAMKLRE